MKRRNHLGTWFSVPIASTCTKLTLQTYPSVQCLHPQSSQITFCINHFAFQLFNPYHMKVHHSHGYILFGVFNVCCWFKLEAVKHYFFEAFQFCEKTQVVKYNHRHCKCNYINVSPIDNIQYNFCLRWRVVEPDSPVYSKCSLSSSKRQHTLSTCMETEKGSSNVSPGLKISETRQKKAFKLYANENIFEITNIMHQMIN